MLHFWHFEAEKNANFIILDRIFLVDVVRMVAVHYLNIKFWWYNLSYANKHLATRLVRLIEKGRLTYMPLYTCFQPICLCIRVLTYMPLYTCFQPICLCIRVLTYIPLYTCTCFQHIYLYIHVRLWFWACFNNS